ncbi:hypothetical protein Tco_0916659 [Tanacetum coccineum]
MIGSWDRFLAAVCLGFSKQLFALFMLCSDKMAEDNVPAPAPTRSDEYILPFNAWLPVGKVDILQNKNFFRAFTASANVPTINIQQFWNTLIQGAKTGVYSFQLDEQWFTLNADLLHEALEITPVDSTHPFESPSVGEQVMDFVNELGYPEEIYFVSKMHVSNLYQLWKAIMSLINQFLTGKTSGTDKPRHLVLQNIVGGGKKKTASKADKPKKPTSTKQSKPAPAKQPALAKQTKHVKEKPSKPTPSKKIRKGKVMKVRKGKRSDHLIGEEDEEPQPVSKPRVEDDKYNLQRGIQMSLESFQVPVGGVAIRKPASGITQRLPVVEGKGKGIATDEQAAQSLMELQNPKKQSTSDQYIFQRRIPVTQDASTGPSIQPRDDTSANVVRDTPSPAYSKIGADTEKSSSEGDTEILNVDEERVEDVSNTMALEERTVDLDEGQAGSDPSKTFESRPLPEYVLMEED